MDPRRLLTFRAVAHERSFSKAAAKLSLTQPSVSHQVGLLETEIGVRLFDRGRGGLRLTRPGEVLLEHADHVAWRLQLADEQITVLASDRRTSLRLGAFPTALAGYVPAAIARLQAAGTDARVRLLDVTSGELAHRLLAGELDIAIGYEDGATRIDVDGAQRIDLLHDTYVMGMAPDHRLADGVGPVDISDLADDDWVLPSADGYLIQACRDAGFEPRVVSFTYDPLAARGIIARGMAVGWTPTLLAHDLGGIVVRPVSIPMPRRHVFALLPPGERHPLVRDVVLALTETAADFGVDAS